MLTHLKKFETRIARQRASPSPNQVLTHAARAAPLVAARTSGGRARRARRALVRATHRPSTRSPNQVLTHAARVAAKQLNKRRARRALVRASQRAHLTADRRCAFRIFLTGDARLEFAAPENA